MSIFTIDEKYVSNVNLAHFVHCGVKYGNGEFLTQLFCEWCWGLTHPRAILLIIKSYICVFGLKLHILLIWFASFYIESTNFKFIIPGLDLAKAFFI